ncbi:MAG: helix-turn-helix domain-containing protein [Planctomycetaceae bacterium]|jgi:transcriptional regulator with XRE-family HTH domain|nr:helix-turn-helix domain-containing protein [Planctomycetaceae bacterium]
MPATLTTEAPRKKRKLLSRRRKEIDTSTYSGKFAQRILDLRIQAGLTAAEVSEKLRVSLSSYQNWERGDNCPPVEMLIPLSFTLRVPVSDLFPTDAETVITGTSNAIDTSTYSGRFAVRLKELRESASLTRKELAERCDLPEKMVIELETAKREPNTTVLKRLAESLEVSVRDMIPER